MSSSSSSPPTSNPTNEILWWPPPSCRPVTTAPGGEEEEPPLDLFACIHAPGSDDQDIYVTRNGLLEIHPSKVVFDSTRLYPSCSRQVQKRIVADLQESHAQTSGGRELAVKEWADESQNRGILRLRLRCKKAKCRLQFQVNWETQKNHWFITRQCQNLVHTCPLPSSTTNTKAAKEGRKKTTTSTNGTKKRAAPTNGTHESFGSNNHNNPAPLTETAPSTMVLSPPVPPATPAVPVGIPTGVHVVPMNSAATNPVAAAPPTTTPLVPMPGGGVPQPLQPGLAAVAPSTSTTVATTAPIANTTVPLVVVTDADRAEAELLATDLQGWVPPPPPATLPTTTTTQPLPQQSLPQPSFMGTTTTTTTTTTAMTDPVVLQHPPEPASAAPLQTLSIPSPHHHHHHHVPPSTGMEQAPMAQPVPIPSSSNTMAPPPTTSIHIPHTIVSTTTGTTTTTATATTPPHHHQEPVEHLQPLQAPSSPLSSPSRYHHPSTTAATINEYEQSAAGMSIGANSTAMMSLDDQDELKDDPAAGGNSGETDGMSFLSESESNMLTLGSVSSKYWMNGLPQIPHANLSRLTSDHYNSIGSWFVDGTSSNPPTTTTTSSKHSLNRRPQPVSSSSSYPMAMAAPPPAMPLASTTTSTTSMTPAPTTTTCSSQQQQQQQHRDSLYSTNVTNSTNNFSINDLTMTSLTDSVRNMLSIVGNHEGGSLSGLMGSGWTRSGSVSQPAAPPEGQQVQPPQQQQDAVTLAEAKSSDPSPRMGILAADFYTPPPTSTGTNTSLHPPPPPSS